jgi:hypothetical protein
MDADVLHSERATLGRRTDSLSLIRRLVVAALPAHHKECAMANWQWIIFWILVTAPFVLNVRRVFRTRRGDHRSF